MNFGSIKQFLTNVSSQLFKNDADAAAQPKQTLWQQFSMSFGFNQNTNANQPANQTLHRLSAHVQLSNADVQASLQREAARLNPALQTKAVPEGREGKTSDGGFIAKISVSDVGRDNWRGTKPADVEKAACIKAALDYGIAKDQAEAERIADAMGSKGIAMKKKGGDEIVFTERYFNDSNIMRAYTDKQGRFEIKIMPSDVQRMREIAGTPGTKNNIGEINAATPSRSVETIAETGGAAILGTAADLTLRQPIQLPKIDASAARAAAAAAAAEAAPVAIAGALVTAEAYTFYRLYESAKDNWQDAQKTRSLPVPLPPLQIEDAGEAPPPLVRPTDTTEAPPKVAPLPSDAELPKGEIAVRPKAAPPIVQAQPNTTAKPTTTAQQPSAPQQNEPHKPKNLDRVVPPIIVAGAASKAVSDALKSKNIAPNGVEKIEKRQWTEAEYKQWFGSLELMQTPSSTPRNIYEIVHTGDKNYRIRGNGEKFWADGISDKTVLEAKLISNPKKSPYIDDSKAADFIRANADAEIRDEFERVSKILRDDNNPLTSFKVITNDAKAVPYFERLMREYRIPGEVVVQTETKLK